LARDGIIAGIISWRDLDGLRRPSGNIAGT
jgi:hypothetical protein